MADIRNNVLVITYWPFHDALVQTYTLPYLDLIRRELPRTSMIHLVTLEPAGIPLRPEKHPGIQHHPFRYVPFGLKGMFAFSVLLLRLIWLVRAHKIDTVHAWCTPAGMLGYLVSLVTGRPLIIDSFEPHAEAMVENGTWTRTGMAFKTLFRFERLQTRRARAVIATVQGMKDYAKERYDVVPVRFFVKPACVDLERFSILNRKRLDLIRQYGLEGKLVCVYAGKFGGIYLDLEVFTFFRACRDHWGDRFHVMLLSQHTMSELLPFMEAEGLSTDMFTLKKVPHQQVPDLLGLGDFAITPVKPVPTKRFCSPIKDGEYWALGLPVVIPPGISDDSDIIKENNAGVILSGSDKVACDHAVLELDRLLTSLTWEELYQRIRPLAETHRNFKIAQEIYRQVYGPQ